MIHRGTVRTGPEVGSHRMKQAVQEHVPCQTERTGQESEGCRREGDWAEEETRTELAVVVAEKGLSGPRRNSIPSQTEPPPAPNGQRAESGSDVCWEALSKSASFTHRSPLSVSRQPDTGVETGDTVTNSGCHSACPPGPDFSTAGSKQKAKQVNRLINTVIAS